VYVRTDCENIYFTNRNTPRNPYRHNNIIIIIIINDCNAQYDESDGDVVVYTRYSRNSRDMYTPNYFYEPKNKNKLKQTINAVSNKNC